MLKNRYFKTTVGVPFELAIGKTLGGSAYTGMADFEANAAVLELDAFIDGYAQSGTALPVGTAWNTAVTSTLRKSPIFFSTLESKLDSTHLRINSTTALRYDTITASLIAYAAPRFEVATLARTGGTYSALQELVFKIVETTPGNEPLPTWDYIYNPAGAEANIWATIAAKINLGYEEEFFTASVNTLVAPVIGVATLVSQAVTAVALTSGGSGIVTASLPNGTGTIPLIFTGGAGTGAAGVLNVVNGVATGATITAAGSGYTSVPTVTIATQTVLPGITITSLDSSRHFRLVAGMYPTAADNADYGPAYTATILTTSFEGSGTVPHLLQLQEEANVRRGIGHYYTDKVTTGTTGSEFGLPVDVVTTSGITAWDLVMLVGIKSEASPTPVEIHQKKYYVFIAVPQGLGSQVKALFV